MQHLTIQTGTKNPILRQVSEPVTQITKEIKKLVKDMELTMLEENGIGLAAPQVGVHKRIILITLFPEDRRKEDDEKVVVMINPEITGYSMEKAWVEEGCLSIPGKFAKVERHTSVEVSFTNLSGQKMKLRLSGIHAQEVQHEIDHLDGVLFTDYLEQKEKVVVERKTSKIA